MVHDHYEPIIPKIDKNSWWYETLPPTQPINPFNLNDWKVISKEEVEALKTLIREFREAIEAAKVVDRLTNQPDCVDPEKAKLEERVLQLEERIAKLEKVSSKNKSAKKKTTRKPVAK